MADTLTPNYGWVQPQVGGDAATWGATLNNDLALIDAQVYANEQATVMVGCITMYGGATAPANWLLCNGQSLSTTGTYAALFAVIGYAFGGSGANFNLPNLGGFFPYGASGGNLGSTGGTTSGNFSVTLGVANMPAHNHAISDPGHAHGVYDPQHYHTISDPGHAHSASQGAHSHGNVVTGLGAGGGPGQAGSSMSSQLGRTDTQQPGVTVNAAGTGIANTNYAPTGIGIDGAATGVTTQNAGSGAAFNVIPPLVAVNFIIRYQ